MRIDMIRFLLILISLLFAAPAWAQQGLTFGAANGGAVCQYNLNLPVIGSGTGRLAQCDSSAILLSDLSKISGTSVLTGAGAVGSGSQRIAVGQDTTTIAGSAPGTAGSASSNVLTIQGIASMTPVQVNLTQFGGTAVGSNPCLTQTPTPAVINNAGSSTTQELIAGTSAKKTYVCSINVGPVASAVNVALVEGTGSTCGTSTAGMAGGATAATGWQFAANGGLTFGSGGYPIAAAATAADNVCLMYSAAVQVSGVAMYVQQ